MCPERVCQDCLLHLYPGREEGLSSPDCGAVVMVLGYFVSLAVLALISKVSSFLLLNSGVLLLTLLNWQLSDYSFGSLWRSR
jgi:hypothetical protein